MKTPDEGHLPFPANTGNLGGSLSTFKISFMEEQQNFFAESKEAFTEYVDERLLLFKLQTVEKTSRLIGTLFTAFLLAILGFFILLFLSIMLGYYFASLTGSLYWGFGLVATFYLILFFIILKLRKGFLERYIVNTIISTIFDKTPEEDDNGNKEK